MAINIWYIVIPVLVIVLIVTSIQLSSKLGLVNTELVEELPAKQLYSFEGTDRAFTMDEYWDNKQTWKRSIDNMSCDSKIKYYTTSKVRNSLDMEDMLYLKDRLCNGV